jgi:FAD/FMN-containing dehydrogenase
VRAVVTAEDAGDVAALVRWAGRAGLSVATQPSGHGATGDTDGVVLLRTARLNELRIDAGQRVARAGAGVAWGKVLAGAGPLGLTGLAGSSPVVSVVGYTLGGGLSWFGRRYGWASDSVRAFDVVAADGRPARVTAESDPELFWALRGGGGDLAVVTAVEFDLHPAPVLYGGRMLWPGERAAEVLAAWAEVTAGAPAELTAWADLLHFPGGDPMVAVDVTHLGDEAEARALLRPLERIGGLLSDGRRRLPVGELGSITAEPTDPGPGLSRAELLTGPAEPLLKELLAAPIDPLLSVQLRPLGGALAGPSDSAAGPLTESYALYLFGVPATPERAAAVAARQRELAGALAPWRGTRKPFTFLAPGERAADAFPAATLQRLRDLKRRRDPRGVLRSNFPLLG